MKQGAAGGKGQRKAVLLERSIQCELLGSTNINRDREGHMQLYHQVAQGRKEGHWRGHSLGQVRLCRVTVACPGQKGACPGPRVWGHSSK